MSLAPRDIATAGLWLLNHHHNANFVSNVLQVLSKVFGSPSSLAVRVHEVLTSMVQRNGHSSRLARGSTNWGSIPVYKQRQELFLVIGKESQPSGRHAMTPR